MEAGHEIDRNQSQLHWHRPLTGTVLETHLGTTNLAKAELLDVGRQVVQVIP